jgi:hypothetical protein
MIITPGAKSPRISVIVETLSVIVLMMITSKIENSKVTKSSTLITMNTTKKSGIELNIFEETESPIEDDLQYDDYPELDIDYTYDCTY